MKHQRSIFFATLLLFSFSLLKGQTPKVLAGPMLGYSEHREALVWVQTICAKKITLQYMLSGQTKIKNEISLANNQDSICRQSYISKFVIENLQPGSTYEYKLLLDGKETKWSYPLKFKTKPLWEHRTAPPDFSFLAGSCNYVNDSAYDRPGAPYGQGTEIFQKMANTQAEFMLWLGDNVYLREADFSSASGIKYRYDHTRSDKNLQRFLASKNHYAIWDDHDYGDNNSGKGFELKETSRQCFVNYWGNKTYGENGEGIYSKLSYSDADFFLLDDRWFRDETNMPESAKQYKTQLGQQQTEWLFYQLAHSKATFKFVCVGGQFLNENTTKESFNMYTAERQKILDFIITHQIGGVVFLSGDRHHTELLKYNQRETELGYSIYELTASAISSKPHKLASESAEYENPMRIKSSLVEENNFCVISISGQKGERSLKFACFDKNNLQQWEFIINESQLKSKSPLDEH
jgi:alkaline phosphatase D